jgi:hypothetical protein
LKRAAEKHGIEVIHYELGCFRLPCYTDTAMIKFSSLYGDDSELEERYNRFQHEVNNSSFQLLSRKQLLTLFLNSDKMHYLDKISSRPAYEMGVSTTLAVAPMFFSQNNLFDEDMILQVSQNYDVRSEVTLRLHPSDKAKATYASFITALDKSPNAIEFILKCRRIISLGSNVTIEAAFWNRLPYSLSHSPVHFMTTHDVSVKNAPEVPQKYLNFYALCFLIPYVYLTDVDYLRWRLTNPPELDVAQKHLDYYLSDIGLDENVLRLEDDQFVEALRIAKSENGLTVPPSLSGKSLSEIYQAADMYYKNHLLFQQLDQRK